MTLNDAYAAGLIDGEGTITMAKTSRWRWPVVSVSSTTLPLLEFLKSNYGGSISKHKTYKKHHKQSWSWKLCNDAALDFLRLVAPMLKEPEKQRRASLLLAQYKFVTVRNGQYNESERFLKQGFERRFFDGCNSD